MKKLAVVLLLISAFISCRNEKDKQNGGLANTTNIDTLTFVYDSIKVYSKNFIKLESNENDTTKATISYPKFENSELNNYIQRQVTSYYGEEEKPIPYQYLADGFVRGYDEFQKENKDTNQTWFLLIKIDVLKQLNNYIALRYLHSDYSGGAHPNTNILYLNYNPKSNKPITLDSLIDPIQQPKLLSIAEAIFRKNEKISDTQSLTDQYFFTDGKFSLPENFFISDKGLTFLYNPYEIKPYSAGITELNIPFSDLKAIAKPNYILTTK